MLKHERNQFLNKIFYLAQNRQNGGISTDKVVVNCFFWREIYTYTSGFPRLLKTPQNFYKLKILLNSPKKLGRQLFYCMDIVLKLYIF